MTDEKPKTLGEDGLFKLLTQRSLAIPGLLGLSGIQEGPLKQEFQHPMQRLVDCLYRLADGTLLNIEHQSSMPNSDDLARRLVQYHNMVAAEFPTEKLTQVIVYTGKVPAKRRSVENALTYERLDHNGHGVRFSVAVINLRLVPADEFRKSGRLDDLILGLMTMGAEDEEYVEHVVRRIRAMRGEEGRAAKEKFLAICATIEPTKAIRKFEDMKMWIEDVKDNPIVRDIVEIAGKARIEEAMRRGLARAIVNCAVERKLTLPDTPAETENLLVSYASEETLDRMSKDLSKLTDFNEFIKDHGVAIPGYTS